MKRISLTKGMEALVDDQDYEFLMQWNWHAGKGGKYAARKPASVNMYMHKSIAGRMGFPPVLLVDHRDGNTMNNQRENLRPSTNQQNLMNRGPQVNNTSKFKGVTFDSARGKWKAQLKKDQRMIFQARFDSKIEAAKAYNKAAQEHFGEFAWLNPILED